MESQVLFYVWWIALNGVTCLASLDFLAGMAGVRRQFTFLYLAVNGVMTAAAVCRRFSGMQFLDMAVLLLFGRLALGLAWKELGAPLAILFALSALIEGFSAVSLSWLSRNIDLQGHGFPVQMAVSLTMEVLFLLSLLLIRRRYSAALRRTASSELYLILLPCFLTALAVRLGLGLDGGGFEEHLSSFGGNAMAAVFVMMTTAAALCFLTLQMFCRILLLLCENQEAAVLKSQVEGQRLYIQEAGRRDEQHSSFRHDLNNHLLVLSGLLRLERYGEALRYAGKLRESQEQGRRDSLPVLAATGNPALDVLLQEKLSHAGRLGIKVRCDVKIPEEVHVEDMDLCIIAANILDNGIRACAESEGKAPFLFISAKSRAGVLVIESVNTASAAGKVKPGTGLGNIRRVAEKYQGTMETEIGGGRFQIRVLLCTL